MNVFIYEETKPHTRILWPSAAGHELMEGGQCDVVDDADK